MSMPLITLPVRTCVAPSFFINKNVFVKLLDCTLSDDPLGFLARMNAMVKSFAFPLSKLPGYGLLRKIPLVNDYVGGVSLTLSNLGIDLFFDRIDVEPGCNANEIKITIHQPANTLLAENAVKHEATARIESDDKKFTVVLQDVAIGYRNTSLPNMINTFVEDFIKSKAKFSFQYSDLVLRKSTEEREEAEKGLRKEREEAEEKRQEDAAETKRRNAEAAQIQRDIEG